jgi:polar amino acid transport system substrate-binding protein
MRVVLVAGCVLALGAGCADTPPSEVAAVLDELPPIPDTTVVEPARSTTTTTSPSQGECAAQQGATKSFRPDDQALAGGAPEGGAVAEIQERGRLRVAVDENTLGFSSRNPSTGEIEGFEVDLAREIATRIFGDDGANRVDLVPVTTDQKFDVVEVGRVDMTISANSMTCSRWERVAFSSEYYTAYQQFLVRADSMIRSADDLDRATVCVTTGSTSVGLLRRHVPEAELRQVPDRTGCLLALQEGEVDAYFGHNSFLYGMMPQDPTVEIRDLLPPADTVAHYGIAISHDQPDLVRFVNAVLEELRTDGTWAAMHQRLQTEIGVPPTTPPMAEYRD